MDFCDQGIFSQPKDSALAVKPTAEDGLADTIRPRLDAAGGIAARVHAVTGIPTVTGDGTRYERPITLADLTAIAETVARVHARLLFIDVLMAYLPTKVDSHRDQDVRSILAQLGERTGCTVLLLRHLNKTGTGAAVYRGGGSIGIIGAARAGYVVAPDPDDDTQRVLACTKNNLAPIPPSLTYRLESAPGSHVARVVWGAESQHSATALLSTHNDATEDGDDIRGWLHTYLARSSALPSNEWPSLSCCVHCGQRILLPAPGKRACVRDTCQAAERDATP